MNVIEFNNEAALSADPVFTFANNTVTFDGQVVADADNAGDNVLQGEAGSSIAAVFSSPVRSASFDFDTDAQGMIFVAYDGRGNPVLADEIPAGSGTATLTIADAAAGISRMEVFSTVEQLVEEMSSDFLLQPALDLLDGLLGDGVDIEFDADTMLGLSAFHGTAELTVTALDPATVGVDSFDAVSFDDSFDSENIGSDNAEIVVGTDGDDLVFAAGGDDRITAGNGNDSVFGDGGNDVIDGGDGNDTLKGGAGQDRLSGGAGNDDLDAGASDGGWQHLSGGQGDDIYHYGKESGNVYIGVDAETASSGAADEIVFSDLNREDITIGSFDYSKFSYEGDQVAMSLHWDDGVSSGELRIANEGATIENFRFADGTVMTAQELKAIAGTSGGDVLTGTALGESIRGGAGDDTLLGNAGDDNLSGGNGDDILKGGAGQDHLTGGEGNDDLDAGASGGGWQHLSGGQGDDTYHYGKESGNVYIGTNAETASSGTADEIVFSDLNREDVTIGSFDYSKFSYEGDQVALSVHWDDGVSSGELRIANEGAVIENFRFADGTVMTADELKAIAGTSGDDVLTGTALGETIRGGAGDDMLFGGEGDDTLNGGAGEDRLTGGHGNDDLDAGSSDGGWQFLSGGQGDDTYHYGKESGNVEIGTDAETASSGTADAIVFSDLNREDLTIGSFADPDPSSGGDQAALSLHWDDGVSSGELRIADEGANIESLQFADGSVMTIDDLKTVSGAGTDDILTGTSLSDIIDGGGGNDRLFGQAGEDILKGSGGLDHLFGGAGNDDLDAGSADGTDTILWQYLFGQDGDDTYHYAMDGEHVYIGTTAETSVSGSADEVIFSDLNRDDFTIESFDYSDYSYEGNQFAMNMVWNNGETSGNFRVADEGVNIEFFRFADGTVMTAEEIKTISGTTADDALTGTAMGETLKGGGGDDVLSGGLGADTFVFDDSEGAAHITDFEDGVDILQMGGDFAALEITNGANGAVVDFGAGSVELSGVDASLLGADDFMFV